MHLKGLENVKFCLFFKNEIGSYQPISKLIKNISIRKYICFILLEAKTSVKLKLFVNAFIS